MSAPTAERPGVSVPQRSAEGDLHLTFIDQTRDAKDAAKLAAEERLTEKLNSGNKFSRFLKGIWHGNMVREYLTYKYTNEEMARIEESGNVLSRESDDENVLQQAQFATIERFQSEYDEVIHEDAGEKRITLEQDAELANEVKDLIRQNTAGTLGDEEMREEAARLINAWSDQHPDMATEGRVRINNMVDIAQAVKGRITHDRSVDEVLEGLKISVGESRSGVRTEVKFNKYEKIVDKIQNTRAGAWASAIVGPETVGIASAAILTATRIGSHKLVAAAAGTFAGAVGGALWSGLRENKRVKEERSQHAREMAQGKGFEAGSKRREEMEATRYESATASELTDKIRTNITPEGEIQDIALMINALSEVETRIKMSDAKKIDLISYSDATRVEEERFALDIARAQAKVGVEQQLSPDMRQQMAILLRLDPDASFNDILSRQAEAQVESIDQDMSAKDAAFQKLKSRRVRNAAIVGGATGLVFGIVAQEGIAALDSTRDGLVENIWNAQNTPIDGVQHKTLLQGGVDRIQDAFNGEGQPPAPAGPEHKIVHHDPSKTYETFATAKNAELTLSSDHKLVDNGNGTLDLVDPNGNVTINNLPIDENGHLPQGSIDILHQHGMNVEDLSKNIVKEESTTEKVDLKDFLQNHKDDRTRITRQYWYDNDTDSPVYDKNEQGLWWGGENGTGVKEDGTYQMTISAMMANGSYHDGTSVDWHEAAEKGDIKLALSASKDTQGRVFLIDINKNGNFNIPPDSPAAQLFKVDDDGQLHFKGAYAEVAHMVGKDENGVERIRPLATEVGENNLDRVKDTVETKTTTRHFEYKITTAGYNTTEIVPPQPSVNFTELGNNNDFIETAPVIPLSSRRALENLSINPETVPYYGYNVERMSAEELRRFERTLSPRLREDPEATLNPGTEFKWYKEQAAKVEGEQYARDIEDLVTASAELSGVTNELESMIMIPVKATGEAESKNIYNLLKTYAQQNSEMLRKNMMLLHVNWFKSAESDPAQLALIQQTQREIERAKIDFPELRVATIESQWGEEERKGGVIGHVARRMNDAAIFALQRATEEGRMSNEHDVLLIRNDADPKGISKNYLENYIKSFEANGETDVFTGTTRFDNRKASELPGFVFASNFMQSMNLIASARDKRVHTGGANFGVRASTFAAVSSALSKESWTGAGSDDVMVGRRIVAARSADRRQNYQGKGLSAYFDRLKNKRIAGQTYNETNETDRENRKVGTVVFGSQIDTDSDRQEALYLQGVPIVHSWDSQYGFDVDGHKDRNESLNSPEMVALKQEITKETPDKMIERIRRDMEGSINNMGATSSVIDTALSMTFTGMKEEDGSGYILQRGPRGGYVLKFTDSGINYLKNKLSRDRRGRFDSYGARLSRQLYGEVRSGARRQKLNAPLASVS